MRRKTIENTLVAHQEFGNQVISPLPLDEAPSFAHLRDESRKDGFAIRRKRDALCPVKASLGKGSMLSDSLGVKDADSSVGARGSSDGTVTRNSNLTDATCVKREILART